METLKKIAFDHQIFSFQKTGDITQYFMNLINNLPEDFSYQFPIRWGENIHLLNSGLTAIKQLPGSSFRIKKRFYYFFNQKQNRKIFRKQDFDVFHPTYYDPWFLNQIQKPFVVTIYDMIHEKFSDSFSFFDKTSTGKRLLAENADHIITVSQQTKNDIIELFHIPDDRISVIYPGYKKTITSTIPLFEKYILYVGERKGYKNFTKFIQAVTPLLRKEKELKVICTGNPFTNDEKNLFRESKIKDQVFQIYASESHLASLYTHALVLVIPSLYEGFGFPIPEAYSNQCPICLSDISSFKEITAGVASFFNPHEKESILDAVEKVIYDSGYAESLRLLGKERVREFSVEKMVEQTCHIYRQY